MNQIKIIEHNNPSPIIDMGDILKPFANWDRTSTGAGWYSKLTDSFVDSKSFFPLSVVKVNTWDALVALSIEAWSFQEQVQYECPYNKYIHYWAIPTHIFSDDIKFWVDRCGLTQSSKYLDHEWMKKYKNPITENGGLRFTKVQRALLGAGYTISTGVYDGFGQIHDALLLLDNGDFLGTKVWVWFNK